MRFVQCPQPLRDLHRMIEDRPRKSIVARKPGLRRGTDIAKLVRKHGVWQAAVEPARIEVCKRDATRCCTREKPPAANNHAAHLLHRFRIKKQAPTPATGARVRPAP